MKRLVVALQPRRPDTDAAKPSTPNVAVHIAVNAAATAASSSSSSDGSAVQTPDPDDVLDLPRSATRWSRWLKPKSQKPSEPSPPSWRPVQRPSPLTAPDSDSDSDHYDDVPVLQMPLPPPPPPAPPALLRPSPSSSPARSPSTPTSPHPATPAARAQSHLRALTHAALTPPPSPPPLLTVPHAPLFPRSTNPARVLSHDARPGLRAVAARSAVLRRLQAEALTPQEVASIMPYAARETPSIPRRSGPGPSANISGLPTLTVSPPPSRLRLSSPGARAFVNRPPFEERVRLYTCQAGALVPRPIEGGQRAVAMLEFSEWIEALAGVAAVDGTDPDQTAYPPQAYAHMYPEGEPPFHPLGAPPPAPASAPAPAPPTTPPAPAKKLLRFLSPEPGARPSRPPARIPLPTQTISPLRRRHCPEAPLALPLAQDLELTQQPPRAPLEERQNAAALQQQRLYAAEIARTRARREEARGGPSVGTGMGRASRPDEFDLGEGRVGARQADRRSTLALDTRPPAPAMSMAGIGAGYGSTVGDELERSMAGIGAGYGSVTSLGTGAVEEFGEPVVRGGGARYSRPAYDPRSTINGGSESGGGGHGALGAGYANGEPTLRGHAGGTAKGRPASIRSAVGAGESRTPTPGAQLHPHPQPASTTPTSHASTSPAPAVHARAATTPPETPADARRQRRVSTAGSGADGHAAARTLPRSWSTPGVPALPSMPALQHMGMAPNMSRVSVASVGSVGAMGDMARMSMGGMPGMPMPMGGMGMGMGAMGMQGMGMQGMAVLPVPVAVPVPMAGVYPGLVGQQGRAAGPGTGTRHAGHASGGARSAHEAQTHHGKASSQGPPGARHARPASHASHAPPAPRSAHSHSAPHSQRPPAPRPLTTRRSTIGVPVPLQPHASQGQSRPQHPRSASYAPPHASAHSQNPAHRSHPQNEPPAHRAQQQHPSHHSQPPPHHSSTPPRHATGTGTHRPSALRRSTTGTATAAGEDRARDRDSVAGGEAGAGTRRLSVYPSLRPDYG
ncbi:hypothetical protein JB92DRAFT_3127642 [Gautieria morchelliformis]|nr:hypothetical protein JB92DRAFT_3127642 [Gautieria morchelliformis]